MKYGTVSFAQVEFALNYYRKNINSWDIVLAFESSVGVFPLKAFSLSLCTGGDIYNYLEKIIVICTQYWHTYSNFLDFAAVPTKSLAWGKDDDSPR